jgi:hypothetical protein
MLYLVQHLLRAVRVSKILKIQNHKSAYVVVYRSPPFALVLPPFPSRPEAPKECLAIQNRIEYLRT